MWIYIYIYAFSRRFYPKRLTVHSGYTFFCQYVFSWNRTHNLLRCWRNALSLSHRNTNRYTNRRTKKENCNLITRSSAFGHMFSSTSHLISSRARQLGNNLLICIILPGIVQLWFLGIQHPILPGWTFGPVDDGQKPSICRLRKTPQWGWGKRSKGSRKRDIILEWVLNQALNTPGMVECHIVPCDHIYWQVVWSLTRPLSLAPVFGTDLLKSHIYTGVHFSTQDQPK